MFAPGAFAAFVLAAVVLVAVPGPTVLLAVGRSLALGRVGGFLSILGVAIGSVVMVCGIALGLGALLTASATVLLVVKVAGAAYLVFLGVQAIRHRRDSAKLAVEQDGSTRTSAVRLLTEGFVVGVTNPKSLAFFVAVLPQFVSRGGGPVSLQLLILGLVVIAIGLTCDALWVLASSSARAWFARSPRRLSALSTAGGGMMIGLGALLLFTGDRSAVTAPAR